jgi:hypothetical protein
MANEPRKQVPDRKSHRMYTGKDLWRSGVWIMFRPAGFVAIWFGTSTYRKQEILVVLLLLSISIATILTFAILFILFQECVRRIAYSARPRERENIVSVNNVLNLQPSVAKTLMSRSSISLPEATTSAVLWGGPVPDAQASDSRANNSQLSQQRQRSLVSIPSAAGQPPSAGSDGNQDGALYAFVPSVYRAAHRDLTPRMPGPHVILDHHQPGGEAYRFPTLL